MPGVQTLVLTVIGDDKTGLVKALADVVAANGGNWERSQLAELAGKFAGIVVVTVPQDQVSALRRALEPIAGLLDVTVHQVSEQAGTALVAEEQRQGLVIEVLGNDRPGIVREVSGVLTAHGLSVDDLRTSARDAPMAGGRLFEAHIVAHAAASTDPASVRAALEALAQEIQVDLSVEAP